MDNYINFLAFTLIGIWFTVCIIVVVKIILQEVRIKRAYKSYRKAILYMRAEEAGRRRSANITDLPNVGSYENSVRITHYGN